MEKFEFENKDSYGPAYPENLIEAHAGVPAGVVTSHEIPCQVSPDDEVITIERGTKKINIPRIAGLSVAILASVIGAHKAVDAHQSAPSIVMSEGGPSLNAPPRTPESLPKFVGRDVREVEEKVSVEVKKAEDIAREIREGKFERALESPYLVSALYYSDKFYEHGMGEEFSKFAAQQIVFQLKEKGCITPELREKFIEAVKQRVKKGELVAGARQLPLPRHLISIPYTMNGKINHPNAIDLFSPEGTPVSSVGEGVVVLAENGWSKSDQFSTSSYVGGNTVIVYSPEGNKFNRYCHFKAVAGGIVPGKLVHAGEEIGYVGETGKNASDGGKAEAHVHFEENVVTMEGVVAKNAGVLEREFRKLSGKTLGFFEQGNEVVSSVAQKISQKIFGKGTARA